MGSIPINIFTFNRERCETYLKLNITLHVFSSRFYCGISVEIRVVSLSVVCKITVQKQRGSWTSGALPQQPIKLKFLLILLIIIPKRLRVISLKFCGWRITVGASPFQGDFRGSDSLHPLQKTHTANFM